MANTSIDSHFNKKQAWMASHVKDAEYPTQESLLGYQQYADKETTPVPTGISNKTLTNNLSFHLVDCHPLMVRYAVTQSQSYSEENRPNILEFFAQLSQSDKTQADDIEITLYIATEDGKPVASGMLFCSIESNEWHCGIYDVTGASTDYTDSMFAHIYQQIRADSIILTSQQ
ncbi:hypothetical protein CS022_02580 [Veronia nyctiphanis]|uniref:Uncharacterized protein n=1 Tax=Veronia nyctiphanis TaxID=1278244 RepID=A0A4Q0YZ47_9GAMM|nr:hypothetical protein [Veronia nyctiphanis]RXJ74489.1 hypothetical protein CS022_02580 [Veronia nyctiphanis]